MTDQNLTEIIVVMDRSGSMTGLQRSMQQGFDSLIADQRGTPGKKTVTLVQFDDYYEVVYAARDVHEVPPCVLEPRGWTSLLDALGQTIDDVGRRLRRTPEPLRPGKVIMVIITDGLENTSKRYTREAVMQKIGHQRDKYHWEFVFLGANQDALAVAHDMGIFYAQNFAATPTGSAMAYSNISRGLQNYTSLNTDQLQGAQACNQALGNDWKNK